ncbi:hypothetical protein Clacol_002707 [Clathrus columnatus]|uniref:Uncharacterized protein n=1 Tax=Clathrus columnatus TaxID=1419009 RepID=A0AAV5A1I7_9AGAM|nr:hypothetical protein Clacol_002707 [Clathrus columnatus]
MSESKLTITTEPFAGVLVLIDVGGVIGELPGLVAEGKTGGAIVRLGPTDTEELIELVALLMGVLGGGGPPVLGPVLGVTVLLSVDPVVSVPPPPLLLVLLPLFVALVAVLEGENGGGSVVEEPPAITL